MTGPEAAACLGAASRRRNRKSRLNSLAVSVAAAILTALLFVFVWGSSWGESLVFGGAWILTGVLGGWFMTAIDPVSAAARSVASTAPAEVTKVDGQKVTVRQADGTDLVWLVESPRELSIQVGERLWCSSPAGPGKHVLGVVEPSPGSHQQPTVLWPADVARTPGRWA